MHVNNVPFYKDRKLWVGTIGILIFLMALTCFETKTPVVVKTLKEQKTVTSTPLANYVMTINYPYSWIDASGGIAISPGNLDDGNQLVSMPFTFTFYNTSFTSIYICTNGFANFQTSTTAWTNVNLPVASPVYMIAPYWEDLVESSSDNIYYQNFASPNRFVIEYQNINAYAGPLVGSFEIVLYETGEIVFNYQSIVYYAGATTGLNYGVNMSYYTQYTALNNSISNFAIFFSQGTTPTPPQNLAATPGNGQVTLTWQPPTSNGGSAITNYKVYRGTSSGSEVFITTLGNVLTYIDPGRTNGQPYYYEVSAVNIEGEGGLSNEQGVIPATVPGAPQNLATTPGHGYVALTWQAPASDDGSAITNYKVYRGIISGGEVILVTLGNVLTYTDTSVTNGQIYFYKVSSVNGMGEGSQSGESSTTPSVALTTASAPRNLIATRGDQQVMLAWQAPGSNGGSAIANYKIYRGTSPGGEVFLITLGNVTTWNNSGLTNGQIYYYKITSVNGVGEGLVSNEASAMPSALPGAPQNLVAKPGNGQITLTWQAPASNGGSAITRYNIYRGTSPGGEVLVITLGNVTSWTNTGLMNGQTYYYKICAVNNAGEGVLSSEITTTPTSTANGLPSNIIIIIIAIAVVAAGVVIVVAVVVQARKKKITMQPKRSSDLNPK